MRGSGGYEDTSRGFSQPTRERPGDWTALERRPPMYCLANGRVASDSNQSSMENLAKEYQRRKFAARAHLRSIRFLRKQGAWCFLFRCMRPTTAQFPQDTLGSRGTKTHPSLRGQGLDLGMGREGKLGNGAGDRTELRPKNSIEGQEVSEVVKVNWRCQISR